jgi:hypothetical protein
MQDGSSRFLSRIVLMKLKAKAVRAGVWFKALPRIDRVLVELTIKVAESIRSSHLAKSIFAIVGKLEGFLENKIMKSVKAVGHPMAEKLSAIAQSWGNFSAKNWITDFSFITYLAVMYANR